MENNFDKYFKDKLEHREFEMSPEHWDAAADLIDKAERGNRRKGLFMWSIGLLLFSVIGILSWNIFSNKNQKETLNGEHSTSSIIDTKNITSNNSDEKNKEITDENLTENNLIKDKTSNVSTENSVGKNENKKDVNVLPANKKDKSQNESKTAPAFPNNTITSSQITNSDQANRNSNYQKNRNSNNPLKSNSTSIDNSIPSEVIKNSSLDNPSEESSVGIEKSNEEKEINSSSSSNPIASRLEIFILPLLELEQLFLKIEKSQPIFSNKNPIVLPTKEEEEIINIHKNKNFAFGGISGVTGYPSSENPIIGFNLGGFAEYRFFDKERKPKNWSLALEALYQYRTGSFVPTKESQVLNFAFGVESAPESLTPTSLHYLEIPILAKYHFGKSKIGFGGSLNYLLAARGEVQKIDETLKGIIPSDGFKKFYGNVLLDYHIKFNKQRTLLGLRANYTLGKILTDETFSGEDALREAGPLSVNVRFVQYFNF